MGDRDQYSPLEGGILITAHHLCASSFPTPPMYLWRESVLLSECFELPSVWRCAGVRRGDTTGWERADHAVCMSAHCVRSSVHGAAGLPANAEGSSLNAVPNRFAKAFTSSVLSPFICGSSTTREGILGGYFLERLRINR